MSEPASGPASTSNSAGGNRERPLVVAVVLTWNDVDMTSRCLETLLASDYPRLQVLLVDNGSEQPCGEQLKAKFPAIELLVLPKNQGFTGGSNRGLERALAMNADYVQLIGNDATFHVDAVRRLVEALENDPRAGGAGPLLLDPVESGKPKMVQFYYAQIDRERAIHHHLENNVPYDSRSWPTRRSDFIPFVAIMFRVEVLREVGMMDESFGTCWEDYDLCVRLLDAGRPLIAVGDALVEHIGHGTTGGTSPYIVYYLARNRLICLFRHVPKARLLRDAPRITWSLMHQMRDLGPRNFAGHRAFLWGCFDFVRGVRGEASHGFDRRNRS